MQRRSTSVFIALVLAMSGCTAGPLDGPVWPEPSPLGRGLDTVRPSRTLDEAATADSYSEPAGVLTLRGALAAALLRSPDLAAVGYEVRAREAEALQAGLLPNPELDVEFENFGGTAEFGGFDVVETTLALSQLVELGGKRVKRRRVAEYETRLAGWEYEIRRIDVLSKTAGDYVGLLAAERQSRIAIETLELAQRIYDVVGERVEAGKVSPVERTKANVELAQADLSLEQANRAVTAARVRVASNWGSTDPQFESLGGDFDHIEPPPLLEVLLERVEQNPDIARWAAEAALRQAEIKLALAQRIPDLTVAGGVRFFDETDETAFVAGVSIPLMVFDRNQGGIRAARLRAIRWGHLEEAARVQIRTAVVEEFQILDTAFISVRTIRDKILPSAQLAFDAAEEAFRQGKIGALGLLDAERTLFDARRQLTAALSTYHLAVIASERLIGAPLHDAAQSQGNNQ